MNRAPGSLYQVDADGWVRNTYLLKVSNNEAERDGDVFVVALEGLDDAELLTTEVRLSSEETRTVPLIVRLPLRDDLDRISVALAGQDADADVAFASILLLDGSLDALDYPQLFLPASPTYSGATQPYVKYGTATFRLKDTTLQLAVYQNLRLIRMPQYRDYLFIPFKDATNGEQTYGGGRYMDISKADIEEGKLTIDFNKAYNPWCAYSDGYSCPVPPMENHLNVFVKAGERAYQKR